MVTHIGRHGYTRSFSCLMVALGALFLLVPPQHTAGQGADGDATGAQIAQFVRDLGSDEYQTREQASARLRTIGAPALSALREATQSADAETRDRAARLVEFIQREQHLHNGAAVRTKAVAKGEALKKTPLWEIEDGVIPSAIAAAPGAAGLPGVICYRSTDQKLHLLDSISGKEKWAAALEGLSAVPPVIGKSLIYLQSSPVLVEAIDRGDGSVKWTAAVNRATAPQGPTLAGDTLVSGGITGNVVAYDAATGKQKWTVELGPVVRGPACPVGPDIAFGLRQGGAVVLDHATGQKTLETTLPPGTTVPPAVQDGILYTASRTGPMAFDLKTGEQKWVGDFEVPPSAAEPAAPGRAAYLARPNITRPPLLAGKVVCVSTSAGLLAVDLQSGKQRWWFQPGPPMPAPSDAAPADDGGAAVAPVGVRSPLRNSAIYTPIAMNGQVLFGSSDGLYCLDAATGDARWIIETGAPVRSFCVADGVLYYAGPRSIMALRLPDPPAETQPAR